MNHTDVPTFQPIPGPYAVHYWTPGHLPHQTVNGLYHDLLHFSAPEAPWCFQISAPISVSPPVQRPIAALRVPGPDGLDTIEATARLLAAAPTLLAALLTLLGLYETRKTEIDNDSSYDWIQAFNEAETAIRTMLPPGVGIHKVLTSLDPGK